MSEDKYEYMLNVWGGFFNDEFSKKHGKKEGYYFFDTMEELTIYLNELKSIKCNGVLMSNIEEGTLVRYKTIAKMKMKYNDKIYDYEYDFGYAYPIHSAYYMFEDGNYSCDCNKSMFLIEKYGDEISELGCGDDIELIDLEVIQIKQQTEVKNEIS